MSAPAGAALSTRVLNWPPVRRSIGVRDDELFGGEEGDNLVSRRRHHDFLLDARGRMAVVSGAVGLEREDHTFLQLDGMLERVQPADDGALVQGQPQAVSELQTKRLHLVVE